VPLRSYNTETFTKLISEKSQNLDNYMYVKSTLNISLIRANDIM